MQHRVVTAALALLAASLLAGCGQKGPLVLPTKPAAAAPATPASASSSARPAGASTTAPGATGG